MAQPTVLVFEKISRWTPELQRLFLGENAKVTNCHSVADVEQGLGDARPSVVVLDIAAAPADVLRYLGRHADRDNAPPAIVVARDRWAELEWRVRELGAVAVVVETISGPEMARLCRRQWEPALRESRRK